MRHVDHGFVRMRAAGQQPDHVAGLFFADRALEVQRQLRGHRHRLETALARGRAQCLQVEPGIGEQRVGLLAGDPALRRQPRRRIARRGQVVLRARPGIADHVPAIRRTRRVVDDQRGGRALARGFFELVDPAAVPGHALAFEQRFVMRVEAGIVDQDHHGLALDVDPGVIVPVLFGRIDPVADEHQLAAVDLHLRLAAAGADHHVVAVLEHVRLAVDVDGERGRFVGGGLHHRHGLEPFPVVARLQADALELRLDVVHRLVLARRAGPAAFEGVGSECPDVFGEIAGVDRIVEDMRRSGCRNISLRRGSWRGAVTGGQRDDQDETSGNTSRRHAGSLLCGSADTTRPARCLHRRASRFVAAGADRRR